MINPQNKVISARSLLRAASPLLCLAALVMAVGGCAKTQPLVPVNSTAEFQSTVLQAKQPVVLLFYKQGCAACAAAQSVLGQLAAEYNGRVVFAEYPLMNFVLISNNPELRDKYEVVLYPTVILFVDGQEKKRWVAEYSAATYRKDIDAVLAPAAK